MAEPAACARLSAPVAEPSTGTIKYVALARNFYAMRAIRAQTLPPDLLGEPGWDMLLDLYVCDAEGRSLSVTALCVGSHVPTATALRYVGMLESAKLISRTRDSRDGRRTLVRLTHHGRGTMTRILALWEHR